MQDTLIVIGNGMAAGRFLETLMVRAPTRFRVIVIGKEVVPSYNRVMLSPVLAGEKAFEDIVTHSFDWFARHGIEFRAGCCVTGIDRAARRVITDSGDTLSYTHLVIATGSRPFVPPLPGIGHPQVYTFRDHEDVRQLAALGGRRVAVLGGGLLGLEAAEGLRQRGAQVSVIHEASWLLNRQIDAEAGALLQALLAERGVQFCLGAKAVAIQAGDQLTGVRLAHGGLVECSAVVVAAGVRPETTLAVSAGLAVERGILVDGWMRTADPHISAIGECIQYQGNTFGLVAPLYEQARICAAVLAGEVVTAFAEVPLATTLKVSGLQVYSCGEFGGGDSESLIFRDKAARVYKRLVIRDDRLVGAVLVGDVCDGARYFSRVIEGEVLGSARHRLMFEPAA